VKRRQKNSIEGVAINLIRFDTSGPSFKRQQTLQQITGTCRHLMSGEQKAIDELSESDELLAHGW